MIRVTASSSDGKDGGAASLSVYKQVREPDGYVRTDAGTQLTLRYLSDTDEIVLVKRDILRRGAEDEVIYSVQVAAVLALREEQP